MNDLEIVGPSPGMSPLCAPILRALPEWFGIPEAVARYLWEIDILPTFTARVGGRTVGFLTLRRHSPHAAEIVVMGVAPEDHRRGIGRMLFRSAERYLQDEGVEFVQVKTLAPSREDEGYRRTREFYEALGFRHLEELEGVWEPGNPCLVMVRSIDPAGRI